MLITDEQVALFKRTFHGRADVYGTYDPDTHRVWQVKQPVTDRVIRDHLEGRAPFGVYLLDRDRVWAGAADFDQDDPNPPLEFQRWAQRLDLPAYLERSKSKGYHVWLFAEESGVLASKVRQVIRHILKAIQKSNTEIFPKQDRLDNASQFGNFINAPLFGRLVVANRSVFLDENLKTFPDQWAFLKNLHRISDRDLGRVPESETLHCAAPPTKPLTFKAESNFAMGLAPCTQRMLAQGVAEHQRMACFRLACQLRRIGFPFELTVATLIAWSRRNRPRDGKSIIRPGEVRSQARCAYDGQYRSYGCEDPAVTPFCDPMCPTYRKRGKSLPSGVQDGRQITVIGSPGSFKKTFSV